MPLSSRGSCPNKKIGRYFRTIVEVFAGQLLKKFLNFWILKTVNSGKVKKYLHTSLQWSPGAIGRFLRGTVDLVKAAHTLPLDFSANLPSLSSKSWANSVSVPHWPMLKESRTSTQPTWYIYVSPLLPLESQLPLVMTSEISNSLTAIAKVDWLYTCPDRWVHSSLWRRYSLSNFCFFSSTK